MASAILVESSMNMASSGGLKGMAGDLWAGKTRHGPVHVFEGLLCDDGGNLASDASNLVVLVNDQDLARFPVPFRVWPPCPAAGRCEGPPPRR